MTLGKNHQSTTTPPPGPRTARTCSTAISNHTPSPSRTVAIAGDALPISPPRLRQSGRGNVGFAQAILNAAACYFRRRSFAECKRGYGHFDNVRIYCLSEEEASEHQRQHAAVVGASKHSVAALPTAAPAAVSAPDLSRIAPQYARTTHPATGHELFGFASQATPKRATTRYPSEVKQEDGDWSRSTERAREVAQTGNGELLLRASVPESGGCAERSVVAVSSRHYKRRPSDPVAGAATARHIDIRRHRLAAARHVPCC